MVSRDEEYLEFVRNNPQRCKGRKERFEDHFEFNSLFYSVYRRFIELLLPITNHFIMKTSKYNYQQCLDLRGIEVGFLNWGGGLKYHGELSFKSGKMLLNLNIVRPDWVKCLVVTGNVFIFDVQVAVAENVQLNFVKKFEKLCFFRGFDEKLKHLVHPNLKSVSIWALQVDKLSSFLDKLNVCQHLESFDIWNTNVRSAAVFLKLKQQLEQLSRRHPHAQISCHLCYKYNFEIHENVLCYQPADNVFVKEYNFEDLHTYD